MRTIYAPFDGQVLSQLVDKGTVLSIGQPVFSLLSVTTLEARFGLPENTAFGLSVGEQYTLRLRDSTFPAVVKSVAKQRTLSTRTIDAVFSIDRSYLTPSQLIALVSGDLVSIDVAFTVQKAGAWVPLSALSNGIRGLWTILVYQVNEGNLVARTVAVEHLDKERAYISGAIRHGEQVVVNGAHRFAPGQKVNQVERLEPSEAFSAAPSSVVTGLSL